MCVKIRSIEDKDQLDVQRQMELRWGERMMAIHGELIDVTILPGFLAYIDEQFAGLLTYRVMENAIEIISLDSFKINCGVGSSLIQAMLQVAKERKTSRLYLTTTNDNTHALHFYQKRGFTISALRIGAVTEARRLKPAIPVYNEDGIPIEHEIELTYRY
ncbi:GNAT family N-acetyltransferase [Sporolactobacillus nakayamae]|uniref:Acetyltransferase (GNAT) family protein n=1 Tax=Sporolactobacillus nakayamae TaxID=269670 RepID=A0A1I2NAF0_9BACL|nr:GNAT family N-acetyltransferase [Sporolactobacillus nakayamae]SFF98486.1 Acetyltransferase (GNAT) family protein [Sporolactobacillus nakayamae]